MALVDPNHPILRFARHLDRAARALDVGDRLADPIQPAGRDVALDGALAVYGQGLYWALTAEAPGALPETLDDAWDGAAPDLLSAVAEPDGIVRARAALARGVIGLPEATDIRREAELSAVRLVLRGLIRALRERRPAPQRASRRKWVRGGLVAVAGLAVVVVAVKLIQRPDLAAGKPYVASSVERDCDTSAGMCQGQPVSLMFHTRLEDSPWVRIDLLKPERISSITVLNRPDCCEERAVPLVLETSIDGAHFTKVAERKEPFSEWKAKFPTVAARYVRARATRNTVLHLEKVIVK